MIPIYKKVKNSLIEDIIGLKYQPGDQLPSETELMNLWSVSRITVRHAISELADEGYCYTIQGKGSFVAEQKISNRLPELTSFSHDAVEQGKIAKREVKNLEIIPACKIVAINLKIVPGSEVIYFQRVLFANDLPVSLSDTFIPLSAVVPKQNALIDGLLKNKSFYGVLHEIGIELKSGSQLITAKTANEEEAKILKVRKGAALISAERVSFSNENISVEYSIMLSRPDQIQWRVNLGS